MELTLYDISHAAWASWRIVVEPSEDAVLREIYVENNDANDTEQGRHEGLYWVDGQILLENWPDLYIVSTGCYKERRKVVDMLRVPQAP